MPHTRKTDLLRHHVVIGPKVAVPGLVSSKGLPTPMAHRVHLIEQGHPIVL